MTQKFINVKKFACADIVLQNNFVKTLILLYKNCLYRKTNFGVTCCSFVFVLGNFRKRVWSHLADLYVGVIQVGEALKILQNSKVMNAGSRFFVPT